MLDITPTPNNISNQKTPTKCENQKYDSNNNWIHFLDLAMFSNVTQRQKGDQRLNIMLYKMVDFVYNFYIMPRKKGISQIYSTSDIHTLKCKLSTSFCLVKA